MKHYFLFLFYCLNAAGTAISSGLPILHVPSISNDYSKILDRVSIKTSTPKIVRRADRSLPSRSSTTSDTSRSSSREASPRRPTRGTAISLVSGPAAPQSGSAGRSPSPRPPVTFPWRQLPQPLPRFQFGSFAPPVSGSAPSGSAPPSAFTTTSAPGPTNNLRPPAGRVIYPVSPADYYPGARPWPMDYSSPNELPSPISAFDTGRLNRPNTPRPLPAAGPLNGGASHYTSGSSTPTQPGSPTP